jgi:threonine/homoserine/homoserine lactone efflux protein
MFPDLTILAVFVGAAVLLLVTPGPVVLFVTARSLDQGRVSGLVSVLGVHLASMLHVAAAAIGLSALLVSSAEAFTIVKLAGAGYLIYLGVKRLMEKRRAAELPQVARERLSRLFWQGFMVNLLNPKTALFFLAFLPQFVDPAHGSVAAQIMVLGAIFMVLGMLSDSLYALAAGSMRGWVLRRPKALTAERYISAATYMGLGLLTAFARRN